MSAPVPPVLLVGAGPGDPELITVAGLNALRRADVVVHDRLAAPELLAEAPSRAEIIDAGKRPAASGPRGASQEAINALLIERAGRGLHVVRLKGGDPFVFGRGGEEADALRAAGVPVAVIPGVTSATAAAALAGIPVTDRRRASSFTVVTGHDAEPDAATAAAPIDWRAIAQTGGTIVILMGWRALPQISRRLIEAGVDAGTAAAAVERASTPQQRSVASTLADLPAAAERAGLRPPVTLIVGAVAASAGRGARPERGRAGWDARALEGRRILVTRPAHSAPALAALLRAQGAAPLIMPAIALRDADPAPIRAAIERLRGGRYDDLIFTSVNGVQRFRAQLYESGGDARSCGGVRLAAIGPATAAALEQFGLRPDLVAAPYSSEGLLDALRAGPLEGRRVLLARAAQGSPALSSGLRAAGAVVDDAALYGVETAPADPAVIEQLRSGAVDTITFTAPSTVRGLVEQAGLAALKGVEVASIGPVTTAAANAAGVTVQIEAAVHTMQGLVQAIIGAQERRNGGP